MDLVGFSVRKYRSIIDAHRLPVGRTTILIGKNNEGKSNLLAALATAMTVVNELPNSRLVGARLQIGYRARGFYDWDRDFPVQLQGSEPDGESAFRLEFRLSEQERADFKTEVGSNLNEDLPIAITVGHSYPRFRVVKRGPGSKTLNAKRSEIAAFIGKRVDFTYIPAVRTADAALDVVRRMVDEELRSLQHNEDYRRAVTAVAELQRPIMEAMSNRIGDALREFLPSIRSVTVEAPEHARYRALRRSVDIIVDDGTPTSLERKGDGVQSLAAIGLLRGINPSGRDLILALEEPESHLHPNAIHRLRRVVAELAKQHQIVLTTHCPLFVDRMDIGSNIVVGENRATPATTIAEIRDLLGVRASDNLRHASLVLVVEGESDKKALGALLRDRSDTIRRALDENSIAIEPLAGAGKLSYKLTELQNAICDYHCFLDNDDAGRRAVKDAVDAGLLEPAHYQLAALPGRTSSEFEDLIDRAVYQSSVLAEYGVDLTLKPFKGRDPWTTRIERAFLAHGKLWNEGTERRLKALIAEAVKASPANALGGQGTVIDALVTALERRIGPADET